MLPRHDQKLESCRDLIMGTKHEIVQTVISGKAPSELLKSTDCQL